MTMMTALLQLLIGVIILMKLSLGINPWASLVSQGSRIHLPRQETRIRSLGHEDPPKKEMKSHPSILAWEIP